MGEVVFILSLVILWSLLLSIPMLLDGYIVIFWVRVVLVVIYVSNDTFSNQFVIWLVLGCDNLVPVCK